MENWYEVLVTLQVLLLKGGIVLIVFVCSSMVLSCKIIYFFCSMLAFVVFLLCLSNQMTLHKEPTNTYRQTFYSQLRVHQFFFEPIYFFPYMTKRQPCWNDLADWIKCYHSPKNPFLLDSEREVKWTRQKCRTIQGRLKCAPCSLCLSVNPQGSSRQCLQLRLMVGTERSAVALQ